MEMDYKEKIKKRKEANTQILEKITKAVELCPDWRFGQILFNLGIVSYNSSDVFFDESVDILQRMTSTIGKEEDEQT